MTKWIISKKQNYSDSKWQIKLNTLKQFSNKYRKFMWEKRLYTNEEIMRNKDAIVIALYRWAETFIWELDEYRERTYASYDYVWRLAENLENEVCDEKDFEDIDFHIWQINYDDEDVIKFID